jgi:predicted nucleic acid-binding protein
MRQVLATINLLRIEGSVIADAMQVGPSTLRALDAIHLATAMSLGRDLRALITYDQRLAAVARAAGISVLAPAR